MTSDRIESIDVLRGFALLGILLINISAFALPRFAAFNPAASGFEGLANNLVFDLIYLLAYQKFMALFSLLFGASIMLLVDKSAQAGRSPVWVHYSRNFWLMVFGCLHITFIWIGDILYLYAIAGFILYVLKHLAPRAKLALGLLVFLLPSVFFWSAQGELDALDEPDREAIAAHWQSPAQDVVKELAVYRGGYREQVTDRLRLLADEGGSQSTNSGKALLDEAYALDVISRTLGMMLIGMAMYSWGVLNGGFSSAYYRRMLILGLGIGLPVVSLGLVLLEQQAWQWQYALFIGQIPNIVATPFVVCGYIGLIMLWCKSRVWLGLKSRLAAVGKTALSNYIGQSVTATLIFYGHGLGLFGALDRVILLAVVVAIWAIQLVIAPLWLKRFEMGPLEWLWRTLTYFRWQRIRRETTI